MSLLWSAWVRNVFWSTWSLFLDETIDSNTNKANEGHTSNNNSCNGTTTESRAGFMVEFHFECLNAGIITTSPVLSGGSFSIHNFLVFLWDFFCGDFINMGVVSSFICTVLHILSYTVNVNSVLNFSHCNCVCFVLGIHVIECSLNNWDVRHVQVEGQISWLVGDFESSKVIVNWHIHSSLEESHIWSDGQVLRSVLLLNCIVPENIFNFGHINSSRHIPSSRSEGNVLN